MEGFLVLTGIVGIFAIIISSFVITMNRDTKRLRERNEERGKYLNEETSLMKRLQEKGIIEDDEVLGQYNGSQFVITRDQYDELKKKGL